MRRSMTKALLTLLAFVMLLSLTGLALAAEEQAIESRIADVGDDGRVDVREFQNVVANGDWSPAIQAAIDWVSEENGFSAGATIFFPPGTYRIDRSIVLGGNKAHWGLHLLGYGATLVGSSALDEQPLVDPEPEEEDAGVPILILNDMEEHGVEGAGYCIEGLRFTRENAPNGIAISVPWNEIPKGTTFRSIKVHGQNIGVHVKFAWQLYFSDCIFRGNTTGMVIQSHGNNIGIVNCIFRRNHEHGLVIGPDRGQWGSNGQHISGSIFEANKGYGILLLSSAQTVISGNYFEANGNDIGVMTPWQTTIDTNLFWGYYGHGWRQTPFADNAHIIVGGCQDLRLRNNLYAGVKAWFRRKEGETRWEYVPRPEGPSGIAQHAPAPPEQEPGYDYEEREVNVLITGTFAGEHVFDTLPTVHHEANVQTTRVAKDTGLHYYEYDPGTNEFVTKSLLDK